METNVESKFGSELQLMLEGKKPMAVFYRSVHERFDETGGQPFREHVHSGRIRQDHFFVSNKAQKFKLIYTVYTVPGEEWRSILYRNLKKIGQTCWNQELEEIEGKLLGYGGYEGKPLI